MGWFVLAGLGEASPPSWARSPKPSAHSKLEQRTFDSAALGEARAYTVYLPAGYERGRKRYPVVYVLHGLGGEPAEFFHKGQLDRTLDMLIARREIQPLIVVAPEGRMDYWVNHAAPPKGSGKRIGDYVALDLVKEVDGRYRTVAAPSGRALAGVSMGGFGATSLALQHPDVFDVAVSLGGALFAEAPTHRKVYAKVWGNPPDEAHWRRVSPLALLEALPEESLPKLFIQCGDHDRLGFLKYALAAHEILQRRGVAHELRVSDGGHDWTNWRAHNADWLRFVDDAFKTLKRKAQRRR